MNIAIDISQMVYGSGVSVYTKLLVENLLRIDDNNHYVLFGGSLRRLGSLKLFLGGLKGNFSSKLYYIPPTLASFIWNRLHVVPIEHFVGDIEVFHSSDWSQPPSGAFKVTTVHDLSPLIYPKLTHPKIVSTHIARLKWVLKDADWVIVPSRSTMEDMAELGFPKDRMTVVPEAPDPIFKPSSQLDIEKVKRIYQINGEYLLSPGVSPRKNTERVISAFEKVRPGLNLKLIIIGQPYMKIEPSRGVKILGHVPLADLPALYSGSSVVVYPSLYEGFGFPILEAFCCEKPVVTSNLGTMKELGEGAAVLVDPNRISSIAEGIEIAMNESKFLVKRGRDKVKEFSWTKTAEETLKIYEKGKK